MGKDHADDSVYLDANGCLTERVDVDGQEVIVHYDDLPESDITLVHGVRCTTPLRTVIDLAPELESEELRRVVNHCLDRKLFTREEAMSRVAAPDIRHRAGAQFLRQVLAS